MTRSYPRRDQTSADAPPRLLLRRMEQVAVAGLLLLALVAMGIYGLVAMQSRGRLIELDRAPRVPVAFELDINAADWPELSVLPNIGETLAKRIVESRQADGPFADVDDLQRVRGIGPRTLEQLRPYLRPLPPGGNVAAQ